MEDEDWSHVGFVEWDGVAGVLVVDDRQGDRDQEHASAGHVLSENTVSGLMSVHDSDDGYHIVHLHGSMCMAYTFYSQA